MDIIGTYIRYVVRCVKQMIEVHDYSGIQGPWLATVGKLTNLKLKLCDLTSMWLDILSKSTQLGNMQKLCESTDIPWVQLLGCFSGLLQAQDKAL